MPTFSIIITAADGSQHVKVAEFDDEASAVKAAGAMVNADHPSVAVARGAGSDVSCLGAWDYEDGKAFWWAEV